MLRKRYGFTLIELLVVIAIIAILAAILFPVFSRAREQARKAACLSNAKQIAMALQMYVQDWDERFPFWRTPCWNDKNYPRGGLMWTEQIMPYLKNTDLLRCPSAAQEWEWCANCYPGSVGRPQNNWRVNYGFNEGIFNDVNGIGKLSRIKSPAEVVVIADNWNTFLTPWAHTDPEGINPRIAFANGPGAGISCGCPATITDMNQAVGLTRHTEGSTLIFADGHAKWYRWDMIKPRILWWKRYGGSLRLSCADIGEFCQ